MSNVVPLEKHQLSLCETADKIVGLAMQLRSALATASPSVPLPDFETDNLIHALAMFVAASERHPR